MYLRAKCKIVKMYIYIYANIFVENIKKDVQRLFLYLFLAKKLFKTVILVFLFVVKICCLFVLNVNNNNNSRYLYL